MPRRLLKILLVLVLLLIGGVACTSMMMPKELKEAEAHAKSYAEANPELFGMEQGIHLARVGTATTPDGSPKPLLFFIHGSPGDWGAWVNFLDDPSMAERFTMLAPDRPGYGKSSPGVPFTTLAAHAEQFVKLVADYPGPKIWAGHSFGAPIIVRAAIDHPDAVDAAILISGGLDPAYEQLKWYHKLGNTGLAKKLLPTSLRMANDEVYLFAEELTAMAPEWEKVRCPTWVVHGTKDSLAPYAEAEFAMAKLTNAPAKLVRLEDANHLVIWNQVEAIRQVFLDVADTLNANP